MLGMSGYVTWIVLEKMAKLFANSRDPDQMQQKVFVFFVQSGGKSIKYMQS